MQTMLVAMVVCLHLRKNLMLGYFFCPSFVYLQILPFIFVPDILLSNFGMLEQIKGLQYIIQHESIPLSEEKKILKEIKQLESTRGEVIANAAVRAKIQESVDKEALQDQVKVRFFFHICLFLNDL